MLPAFRAVAPAKHQTTLRIRCARNGFALLAPLIIRVAVVVGKLAQTVENQLVAQLDTAQVQYRILHRLVHIATLTGMLALQQRRKNGDQQMHSAVGIAQCGAGLRGHIALAVIPAGGGSGTARGLRDRLERLDMLEPAALVEALQRRHDQTRIDRMYVIPSETKLFHVSRADILYEHVGFLQEFGEDFLAFRISHVQRDGFLVGIELKEVQGVRAIHVVHFITCRISALHLLHLDDVGAHPCEHLRARRAGLHLRPVNHGDAFQWRGVLRCLCCRIVRCAVLHCGVLRRVVRVRLIHIMHCLVLLISGDMWLARST